MKYVITCSSFYNEQKRQSSLCGKRPKWWILHELELFNISCTCIHSVNWCHQRMQEFILRQRNNVGLILLLWAGGEYWTWRGETHSRDDYSKHARIFRHRTGKSIFSLMNLFWFWSFYVISFCGDLHRKIWWWKSHNICGVSLSDCWILNSDLNWDKWDPAVI